MNKFRKVLILGINKALEKGCFSLEAPNSSDAKNEEGHIRTRIAGFDSVILWRNIGYDELRVAVWLNYDHKKHPQAGSEGVFRESFRTTSPLAKKSNYRDFVGAVIYGEIERKTGTHLMGVGGDWIKRVYVRADMQQVIDNLPEPKPLGYRAEGQTFF